MSQYGKRSVSQKCMKVHYMSTIDYEETEAELSVEAIMTHRGLTDTSSVNEGGVCFPECSEFKLNDEHGLRGLSLIGNVRMYAIFPSLIINTNQADRNVRSLNKWKEN